MKESLSDQAYENIKRDIITCIFEPGSQIAQPKLAERYEIGMTPIREALKRLSQEGLVESVPRYGYIVSQITFSSIVEIYEVRMILESSTVRLAAERASQEQLEAIVKLQDFKIIPKDRENYLLFLGRNASLHLQIAETTGNKQLFRMIKRFHDSTTRFFHYGLKLYESSEDMRQEHVQIAGALFERDADLAERLMRDHISHAQSRVVEAASRRLGVQISAQDQKVSFQPQGTGLNPRL
jgi:DNA-binding GntR family transcriptional regulator